MTAAIAIYGDKALIKALTALPINVYARVIAGVNKKTMTPVLKMARQLVPVRLGLLKKSLGIKTKKYPKKGIIFTLVGPRLGFGQSVTVNGRRVFSDPVKYSHLIELGHRIAKGGHTLVRREESVSAARARAKGQKQRLGQSQGFVPAQPFIRPAWDANKQRIVPRYKGLLWDGIKREAVKLAKAGK